MKKALKDIIKAKNSKYQLQHEMMEYELPDSSYSVVTIEHYL